MALPASQYSVLDGAKVERLTDDTFRVNVSGFSFFSFEVEPILTVSVQPTDAGCRIEMLACKLAGSRIVEAQNNKFSARMVNNGADHITQPLYCPASRVQLAMIYPPVKSTFCSDVWAVLLRCSSLLHAESEIYGGRIGCGTKSAVAPLRGM